mgnify:CR=1 FL=1
MFKGKVGMGIDFGTISGITIEVKHIMRKPIKLWFCIVITIARNLIEENIYMFQKKKKTNENNN